MTKLVEDLIEAASKDDFVVLDVKKAALLIKKMILVRKGQTIDEKTATERANNIAASLADTLVKS